MASASVGMLSSKMPMFWRPFDHLNGCEWLAYQLTFGIAVCCANGLMKLTIASPDEFVVTLSDVLKVSSLR